MIKFIYKNEVKNICAADVEYTINMDELHVDQLLEHFSYFMKAIGYSIPDGFYLDIVADEPKLKSEDD